MSVENRASSIGNHSSSAELSTAGARLPTTTARVVIEHVRPDVDGGRFPIKRTPGESLDVVATVFADGHDAIAAVLRDRHIGNAELAEHAEKRLQDLSASSAGSAFERLHDLSASSAGSAFNCETPWR